MPRVAVSNRLPTNSVSVTDSFNGADNPTSLGSSWISAVGTWGISSNRAVNTDSGTNIALIETGVGDYTSLSATINMPLGKRAGLVFRATDANNYLEFDVNQGSTANSIIKCVAGTRTTLTSINTGVAINDEPMQIILTGKRIQCYYAATLRLDYTLSDADYALFGRNKTKAGLINIGNTTVNFNDFSAAYTTTGRTLASKRQRIRNFGSCLSFNGSSDNVTSALWSSSVAGTTMSVWFKALNYKTTNQPIISNGDGVAGTGRGQAIVLSGNSTTDGSMYVLNHVLGWVDLGFKVRDNNWHHIVCVINSTSSITTYLDGVSKGTVSGISPVLATPITASYLGKDGAARFFGGLIDDARYYTSALSSTDAINMFYGIESAGTPANWYKLNEGSGTTATDSGSAAKTGTITGATYSTDVFMKARPVVT